MKFAILALLLLVTEITTGQILRYDIYSYENCIYDKKKNAYDECKDLSTDGYLWIEVDKTKYAIRFMVSDTSYRTYQIKKISVAASSTDYYATDKSGMVWLYRIITGNDNDLTQVQVWQCNKKGEIVYVLGKTSVGVWQIDDL